MRAHGGASSYLCRGTVGPDLALAVTVDQVHNRMRGAGDERGYAQQRRELALDIFIYIKDVESSECG